MAMAGVNSAAAYLWDVENDKELPPLLEGNRYCGSVLAFSRAGK
jgi:hypothetical protein